MRYVMSKIYPKELRAKLGFYIKWVLQVPDYYIRDGACSLATYMLILSYINVRTKYFKNLFLYRFQDD